MKNEHKQYITQHADQCVKCAACLPHCPTYNLKRDENESPRGRIALIDAHAQAQLPATPGFKTALDHCLSCGACERACPAKVPYLSMLHKHRQLLKPRLTWATRGLLKLCHSPKLQRLIEPLLAILTRWRHRTLPYAQSQQATEETVLVLSGCLGECLEAHTLKACQRLLQACGLEAQLVTGCCGGLARQVGQTSPPVKLTGPAISLRTGCQSHWQAQSPYPVYDLIQFLNNYSLTFKPLAEHIAFHQPCSASRSDLTIFERIPGIRISLFGQGSCCGGAGLYPFQHAKQAQQLAQSLINQIPTDATSIVSSNIGCIRQLRRFQARPVYHMAEYLAHALVG